MEPCPLLPTAHSCCGVIMPSPGKLTDARLDQSFHMAIFNSHIGDKETNFFCFPNKGVTYHQMCGCSINFFTHILYGQRYTRQVMMCNAELNLYEQGTMACVMVKHIFKY